MGTIKLGNDYLFWVETVTPGTFVVVDGQGSFSHSRQRSTIATATKTSGWDTERAGLPKGSAKLELIPTLPDTGYDRLETQGKAEPQVPFNVQVRRGGTAGVSPGDVVFECAITVSNIQEDKAQNDTVKASYDFLFAGAPTVDKLK